MEDEEDEEDLDDYKNATSLFSRDVDGMYHIIFKMENIMRFSSKGEVTPKYRTLYMQLLKPLVSSELPDSSMKAFIYGDNQEKVG